MKTIPFTAAHTYIAHIWQCPPPGPFVDNDKTVVVIPGFLFASYLSSAFKLDSISPARERGEIASFENSIVRTAQNYISPLCDSLPAARDRDAPAAANSKIISRAECKTPFPSLDLGAIDTSVPKYVFTSTGPANNSSTCNLDGDALNQKTASPLPVDIDFPG